MPKPTVDPIEGKTVRLRLLEEADLPLTLAWRNQDNIRKWFFHSEIITPHQHKAWFDQYSNRDDDFVFIIELLSSQACRPVGQVALYHIDWNEREAEFGRLMIGEIDAHGKGFASEATNLVVKLAREQFKLRQIYLEVFSDNLIALSIYANIGFKKVFEEKGVTRMVLTQV